MRDCKINGVTSEEKVPFLQFDRKIRTIICTTNAIESINARTRRAVKRLRSLPDRAGRPHVRLPHDHDFGPAGKDQQRWSHRWKAALNAFEITFDGRLSAGRK